MFYTTVYYIVYLYKNASFNINVFLNMVDIRIFSNHILCSCTMSNDLP